MDLTIFLPFVPKIGLAVFIISLGVVIYYLFKSLQAPRPPVGLAPAPVPQAPLRFPTLNKVKALVIISVILVLSGVTVTTAIKLYQTRFQPVAPTVPQKIPFAACNARWPADPNTACGRSTQSPAQNATGVSLTPSFHWDYGGYRAGETGCAQLSDCSSYGAAIYLAEGSYSDSSIIASCNLPTSGSPIKDASFSCFRTWRDGPVLTSLKPNTLYSWSVTPYYGGIVHAEQTWTYSFTTGSTPPPPPPPPATHKACQNNTCATVSGAGADTCQTDANCASTVACNQTCNGTTLLCPSNMTCDSVSNTCRNPSCPTQTSCVCPPPPPLPPVSKCDSACNNNSDCPSGLVCDSQRCRTPACLDKNDCNCTTSYKTCRGYACISVPGSGISNCSSDVDCQPKAPPPVVPVSGNELPTMAAGLGGVVLLILSLLAL